ncbi:MAG TPA: hypothetical protein VFF65_05730 [Phycisphaerales bacterium]|nr:hypothetical protein [Phycisphaerales bacterium]
MERAVSAPRGVGANVINRSSLQRRTDFAQLHMKLLFMFRMRRSRYLPSPAPVATTRVPASPPREQAETRNPKTKSRAPSLDSAPLEEREIVISVPVIALGTLSGALFGHPDVENLSGPLSNGTVRFATPDFLGWYAE